MQNTAVAPTLASLSRRVQRMAASCGFADEPPLVLLALLASETGEVARAVCAIEGVASAPDTASANLPDELADVVILALRLATAHHIDLGASVQAKCAANERRYAFL